MHIVQYFFIVTIICYDTIAGEDSIWWTLVRVVLPGLWLIMNPSVETIYGFLFSLNVIGCLFLSVLLYYYARQMLTNTTTRERTEKIDPSYDKGPMANIVVSC